ncbi:carbohydrate porin [Nostoc sp. CENA67]|uniref:Carbohydrate porin n=1 Tax=Amazonocrinis nigriterrae CENA67 TaxID=2794033 RepID=A0A8J7L904_9NOST|nr:iron uptake porin [Amazonocrinis nigriterrae]MBH8562546.1 carbohydrate porin [Amazonocrinis nigriterrae CENA67]
MLSCFRVSLGLVPAALMSIVLLSAIAKVKASDLKSNDDNSANQYVQLDLAQITSVSQLSDVQPTDWAFQALQTLIERYGCIAGYPDGRFKGDRAMTRFEFASGLNACLDKINQQINTDIADIAIKEDLVTLQKLQEEFAAEIATLRGRIDTLEARTEKLEQQQFSTTTKLDGQIIFAVTDAFGDASRSGNRDNSNLTFSDRIRLNFVSSFTGKDELRVRIQASNVFNPNGPGNDTRLSFASGTNTTNDALLSKLQYRFLVGDKLSVLVATGFNTYFDDWDVINPLSSDAESAISRFGRYSPIYRLGGDTGAGVTFKPTDNIKAELAYLAKNTNDPASGLFNSGYGALGQIIFYPNKKDPATKIALTYVNSYNTDGLGHNTGSLASNLGGRKVSANAYGIETNVKVSDQFQIGGWVTYIDARALTGDVKGDADVWSWAVTMAFHDLGKKGNLGGIIVGMQPKLTGTSAPLSNSIRRDPDTGFHIEGFYRYKINDNISITPGLIWLTAPNHDDSNGDIFLGVVRTTFKI